MQCIYSCPDFFRIDEDTWFFGSLDQQYWLGSYANQTFTPNDFYAAKPGVLLDSTIWKTGAKAGWWDRPGRRLMWGGYRSMMTMPRELSVGGRGELRLRFVGELAALRTAAALTSPAATVGRHLEINATLRVGPFQPRPAGRPAPVEGLLVLNTTTIGCNGTHLIVTGPQVSDGVNGGHYTPFKLEAAEELALHVFVVSSAKLGLGCGCCRDLTVDHFAANRTAG